MWTLVIGLLLVGSLPVEAATVCRVKSTGQVVESYSTTQDDGLCQLNLIRSGIASEDIEQVTVTEPDREALLKAWAADEKNPDVQAQAVAQQALAEKKAAIQEKLALTDAQLDDLKLVLQ